MGQNVVRSRMLVVSKLLPIGAIEHGGGGLQRDLAKGLQATPLTGQSDARAP